MGGIKNRDLFSTKFLNAVINGGQRFFVIHIKQYLGNNFFLAKIERKYHLFKIDPTRIKLYHHFGVQNVAKIDYELSNYNPIDEKQVADLENILNTNSLSKVDRKMFKLFDVLGKREKLNPDGTLKEPHKLDELLAEAKKYQGDDEAVLEIIEYMRHLDVKQIVTPVKRLSEFLYKDLKEPDPGFADQLLNRSIATDKENKRMTNIPVDGKSPLLKIVLVLLLVGLVVGVIAYGFQTGQFSHILPSFGASGGSPLSFTPPGSPAAVPSGPLSATSPVGQWASAYPTPQSLESAINSHQIACTQLPKEVKDMVNTLPSHPC